MAAPSESTTVPCIFASTALAAGRSQSTNPTEQAKYKCAFICYAFSTLVARRQNSLRLDLIKAAARISLKICNVTELMAPLVQEDESSKLAFAKPRCRAAPSRAEP